MTTKEAAIAIYRPQLGTRAVDVRRAVLDMPGVLDAFDVVERAVFVATTDRPFSDYPDAELVAALADALKWIAKDVGIRDTDSSEWKGQVVRISQIVRRYYPNHSIKDVKMAFELTVTGELNDHFPKDRQGNPDKGHYQMFNAEYFCKVMNAYNKLRGVVVARVLDAVPKPERARDVKEEVYFRNLSKRNAVDAVLWFKYHGRMPKLSTIRELVVYEVLAGAGLADEVEVTVQEQREAYRMMMFRLTSRMKMGDAERLKEEGVSSTMLYGSTYRLARRRVLSEAFARIADDEIQVTDYITFE